MPVRRRKNARNRQEQKKAYNRRVRNPSTRESNNNGDDSGNDFGECTRSAQDDQLNVLSVNNGDGNDSDLTGDEQNSHRLSSFNEGVATPWWTTLAITRIRAISHSWRRKCGHCQAELLTNETSGFCCNFGKHLLPQLPPLTAKLNEIYNHESFSHNSRKINSLFSFTSIGAEGHFVRFGGGVSSVVVQGRVYHRILPGQTENCPLRWILYDANERETAASNLNMNSTVVRTITDSLNRVNPYMKLLRRLKQDTRENRALVLDTDTAGNEIAAIMCIDNTTTIGPRSVVIHYQSDAQPTFMNSLNEKYEPLQYPLLFPHGTKGWSPHEPLTQIWYYRNRLLHEPRFQLAGRLVNEYLVDMFSRVEEQRLNYIRNNQPDAACDEGVQANGGPKANHIYLPSSFLGGSRWCSEQTADALAIVAKYGKPSFFITMTTNPHWKEIQSKLKPGQNYADIPMVVVRAFRLRLMKLKKFLRQHFGRVIFCVSVVEFQKRGLPHAHLAVKVTPEPKCPEEIDQVVLAELPQTNEKLKALVLKHMIHNHASRCRKEDGSCQYKYPQKINPRTKIDDRGYVHYKRGTVEDANVVPYNPHLLLLAECHINVEIASTVNLIMYLYKYLFKGGDHARFIVTEGEEVDEIKDYIKGRYLSAMEAARRISAFHISEKTPCVECLKIHLQDQQRNFTSKSVLSPLQRYFLRPKCEPFVSMSYTEYHDACTFKSVKDDQNTDGMVLEEASEGHIRQEVRLRKRGEKISRIQMYYPSAGELFYLRVLLLHKSALSFDDLKTVDGVGFSTFQEAAQRLGLIRHGEEGEICLAEAVENQYSPRQLLFLFSELILEGSPSVELFNKYQSKFMADMIEKFPEDQARDIVLSEIANYLEERGKTMDDYGLPNPVTRATEVQTYRNRYLNNLADLRDRATEMRTGMNQEQQWIYDMVVSKFRQNESLMVFIDGRAGRGKTFLVQALCNYVRSQGKIILPCATTALAASNYSGGITAHSLFRIPVEESNERLKSTLQQNSDRWKLLKESDVIVWDEFGMINKAVFMCAEELMRCIMGSREPFGGKLFIALGDFRQNAPVVRGGGKTATIMASVRTLSLWDKFRIERLTERVRDAEDPEWSEFADSVGDGVGGNRVEINLLAKTNDEAEAINFIYPQDVLERPEDCLYRSILCTLNKNVDSINEKILQILPGNEHVLHSLDSIKENGNLIENGQFATNEFLNNLKWPGIPDHTIKLKDGCQCCLMKNLTKSLGLCKNTRVVIKATTRNYVEVQTIGVNSERYLLPRVEFFFKLPWNTWTVYRRQFPLRLAYACTYNSAIGLTLDKVVFDLRSEVFSHGQLYTGLTRIRGRNYGMVLGNIDDPETAFQTANVVYHELLL